jgi:hypothetical protein
MYAEYIGSLHLSLSYCKLSSLPQIRQFVPAQGEMSCKTYIGLRGRITSEGLKPFLAIIDAAMKKGFNIMGILGRVSTS